LSQLGGETGWIRFIVETKVEHAIASVADDELVEVTTKAIRRRKRHLDRKGSPSTAPRFATGLGGPAGGWSRSGSSCAGTS
jgi:hypothetical protein